MECAKIIVSLKQLIEDKIETYLRQGLNQHEIAKLHNVSQSSVCRAIQKIKAEGKINRKSQDISVVIDFIEKHGGTIQNALKQTNSDLDPASVRKYAKKIGFDYKHYRYAYKRYGKWLVLPGNTPIYVSDFSVEALCTGCNTVHKVSLCNLRAGRSKSCHDCGKKVKNTYKVRRHEDGKVFKSIRSWVTNVSSVKQYSNLKSKIQRNQRVRFGEFTYSLEAY